MTATEKIGHEILSELIKRGWSKDDTTLIANDSYDIGVHKTIDGIEIDIYLYAYNHELVSITGINKNSTYDTFIDGKEVRVKNVEIFVDTFIEKPVAKEIKRFKKDAPKISENLKKEDYNSMLQEYNSLGAQYEDTEDEKDEVAREEKRKELKEKMDVLESKINGYERSDEYKNGGKINDPYVQHKDFFINKETCEVFNREGVLKHKADSFDESLSWAKDQYKVGGDVGRKPKYNVGDYVSYKTGDVHPEKWVGIVRRVVDLDKEYAYRIDAYQIGVTEGHGSPMMDSEKTNEKYEVQLNPSNFKTYINTKGKYEKENGIISIEPSEEDMELLKKELDKADKKDKFEDGGVLANDIKLGNTIKLSDIGQYYYKGGNSEINEYIIPQTVITLFAIDNYLGILPYGEMVNKISHWILFPKKYFSYIKPDDWTKQDVDISDLNELPIKVYGSKIDNSDKIYADDKTLKEAHFLMDLGYEIDTYSEPSRDAYFEIGNEVLRMVQGHKGNASNGTLEIGIAYFIEDFEEPITKNMLRHVMREFNDGTKITLYTNAGVEVHSKEMKDGMFEKIKIVKVSLEEIENQDKFSNEKFSDLYDKETMDILRNRKNEITATFLYEDDFSREVYKGSDNELYVIVDGEFHTMTDEGEPIAPVKNVVKAMSEGGVVGYDETLAKEFYRRRFGHEPEENPEYYKLILSRFKKGTAVEHMDGKSKQIYAELIANNPSEYKKGGDVKTETVEPMSATKQYLTSISEKLPVDAREYLNSEILTDPDLELLDENNELLAELKNLLYVAPESVIEVEPVVEEPTYQDMVDAIAGLETMIEFADDSEKQDYIDAVEGLKTMLEFMEQPKMKQGGGVGQIDKQDIVISGVERSDLSEKDWEFILRQTKYSKEGSIILKNKKGLDLKDSKGDDIIAYWSIAKKEIENQYEGMSPEDVWNTWSKTQRKHFLGDHKLEEYSGAHLVKYNFIADEIKEKLKEHVISGQYSMGGVVDTTGTEKLKKLGINYSNEFGDKYRKWLVKVNKVNSNGDYVGYQMSLADDLIKVIGKKGTVDFKVTDYENFPKTAKAIRAQTVHYKDGGKICSLKK